MKLFWIPLAVILAGLSACAPEGVGDPCDPVSCPAPSDDPTNPDWLRCDWDEKEVYLEGRSLQCRTRVCMVFRVNKQYQNPDRTVATQYRSPYCTQPCGPGANIEDCPAGYCCLQIISQSSEGAVGSYCVDKEDLFAGTNKNSDCEMVYKCYKKGSTSGTVDSYDPDECL